MGEQGKVSRRAILVGAARGAIPLERIALRQPEDVVICADGGRNTLEALGVRPDWYVGDNDSGGRPEGLPAMLLPPEKDVSDLEMAVSKALELGCTELILTGCTGGRLDHGLANLGLLEQIHARRAEGVLMDEMNEVRLLTPGRYEIENRPAYHYIGLIPLDAKVTGVSLTGVKYPLHEAELYRGSTLSISNEILPGRTAAIEIGSGCALLIRSQPEQR